MTNFSEKGHAKNVANLGTFIAFTTGFGTGYNPSKKSISLAALNTLKEEAEKNLTQVNTHFANWTVAVEAQQAMFAKLNVHPTRIVNAVENCEVPPAVITSAKALNRKLQGSKSRKAETPGRFQNQKRGGQNHPDDAQQRTQQPQQNHLQPRIRTPQSGSEYQEVCQVTLWSKLT